MMHPFLINKAQTRTGKRVVLDENFQFTNIISTNGPRNGFQVCVISELKSFTWTYVTVADCSTSWSPHVTT